jgi:hypothetical protein
VKLSPMASEIDRHELTNRVCPDELSRVKPIHITTP